jgi:hypothetical protein
MGQEYQRPNKKGATGASLRATGRLIRLRLQPETGL